MLNCFRNSKVCFSNIVISLIILFLQSKIKHDNSVDVDKLAKMTVGFSGADLENMVNTAAIRAAVDGESIKQGCSTCVTGDPSQGVISSTFYMQLLHVQIPKVHKIQSNCLFEPLGSFRVIAVLLNDQLFGISSSFFFHQAKNG